MNTAILSRAANEARGLAIDAIHKAGIGHLGLPLGAADIGAVLFSEALRFDPAKPCWLNRDRFVLSAGHGSMFLYGWLHLAGYALSLDEVKNFRQLHSITPGHPEFHETPGVECTTGPLGQGIGNAVGLAAAAKMAGAIFNTPEFAVVDHKVVCLAGDGCIQEGVGQEALALAGHLGLDNLILIFDSNDVTLDGPGSATQSTDFVKYFESIGFDAVQINGHDMAAVLAAYNAAKTNLNGKPKVIIAKTVIGLGIPEVAGTSKAHGEGGAKFGDKARLGLGLPADQHFFVSDEVRAHFAAKATEKAGARACWEAGFQTWRQANPDKAALLDAGLKYELPADLMDAIPAFAPGSKAATRVTGGVCLNALAKKIPFITSGSADLHGSTKNYLDGLGDFTRSTPLGRNFKFGIREHAMGAMVNGFGYYGLFRASGATFLAFADYMRGAIRLSALSKLPVLHIFTHDSVAVGEDGPTHQPVETTASLRLIPGLDVIRPADAEEAAGAFVAAMLRTDGPTSIILSRQDLPNLDAIPVATRRQGVLKGAYIARKETAPLKAILLSSGSELNVALAAAEKLGPAVRVVSVPSFFRFDQQPAAYREEVLPTACRARIAVEAGVDTSWWKYIGLDGKTVAINRFGLSAPGNTVMKELGISPENVVATVQGYVAL